MLITFSNNINVFMNNEIIISYSNRSVLVIRNIDVGTNNSSSAFLKPHSHHLLKIKSLTFNYFLVFKA